MDFFSRQNDAQARSRAFFTAFFPAVFLAVVILYFVITACMVTMGILPSIIYGYPQKILSLRPFLIVGSVISGIIFFISWRTIRTIKKGGGAYIAQVMGGELLETPKDLKETQIINVVEEMAVASGLPRPRIYIFPNEFSINAVTAGLDHDDAIIALTCGAVTHLSRDELQCVVAHEFAHILNGDYALNLTMAGWLSGLLFFSVKGLELLSVTSDAANKYINNTKQGDVGALLLITIVGVILYVGGGIGKLGAELVQAAISRQREYMADAFAVQFTRNPASLAGALKKIAGYPRRGTIKNSRALMMKSFFIASPTQSQDLWQTHPPLEERITTLDPHWDGKIVPIELPPIPQRNYSILGHDGLGATTGGQHQLMETAEKLPTGWPGALVLGLLATGSGGIRQKNLIGQGMTAATSLCKEIPAKLLKATTEPAFADPLIAAIFCRNADFKAAHLEIIRSGLGPEAAAWAEDFQPLMADSFRLPLLSLATPALKAFNAEQRLRLAKTIKELIEADGKLDLFEIAAWQILKKHLGLTKPKSYSYQSGLAGLAGSIQKDAVTIVSAMAHLGSDSREKAEAAFAVGMTHFTQWPSFDLLPSDAVTSKELALALDRFSGVSEKIKNTLVLATVGAALHDHQITQKEYELLRALAAALDIPLPLININ